jgi:hypothetical protein
MSTKPPSESPGQEIPSVARLLRAVSPAMEAELGRVIDEYRAKLQAEATVQLRKALIDKEAELKTRSEAECARARAETAEKVRQELTRELESRFEKRLAAELSAQDARFHQDARQAELGWEKEHSGLRDDAARWRVLAEFLVSTGAAVSQTGILRQFLRAAGHFSGAVVLYLDRAGGLARWGTEGAASAFPELVSEDTKDPDWFWVPVTVRRRMVVTVGATQVRDKEALDILVGALKGAIENLGLRLGSGGLDPGSPPKTGESPQLAARHLAG